MLAITSTGNKMYQLVFGRPEHHTVLKQGKYHEVIEARMLSGDLVVYVQDHESQERDGRGSVQIRRTYKTICQGDDWLFEWEKKQPKCYARTMQQKGWQY